MGTQGALKLLERVESNECVSRYSGLLIVSSHETLTTVNRELNSEQVTEN